MKTSGLLLAFLFAGLGLVLQLGIAQDSAGAAVRPFALDELKAQGELKDGRASFLLQGQLKLDGSGAEEEPIVSIQQKSILRVHSREAIQEDSFTVKRVRGDLKELVFDVKGSLEILKMEGGLLDWSIRTRENGARQLVVRLEETEEPSADPLTLKATSKLEWESLPQSLTALAYQPATPGFHGGDLEIRFDKNLSGTVESAEGLYPTSLLKSGEPGSSLQPETKQFYFTQSPYRLALRVEEIDPQAKLPQFLDYQLTGEIREKTGHFTLQGTVRISDERHNELDVLSGAVALQEYDLPESAELQLTDRKYRLVFEETGEFEVALKFIAKVVQDAAWKSIEFETPSSPLRPLRLTGFDGPTQIELNGAVSSHSPGEAWLGHLPAQGPMRLRWQTEQAQEKERLFFAVNGYIQGILRPGLIRQTHLMSVHVMQGRMREVRFDLVNPGEIVEVAGADVLNWTVRPRDGGVRELIVEFNQDKQDRFFLQIQSQQSLGAFPAVLQPMKCLPVEATRFNGHLRLLNEGAVRLQPLEAGGLVQVSPAQFPTVKILDDLIPQGSGQTFAYRFASGEYTLRLQADPVLPEVTASQIVRYHFGETDLAVFVEMELDIREAPLREFSIPVPDAFSVIQVNAPNLGDYQVQSAGEENAESNLVLQFSKPVTGRQILSLQFLRNHESPEGTFSLPAIAAPQTKSLRGFAGVSAEKGLQINPVETEGLTEISAEFFPIKNDALQWTYRLRDEAWTLTVNCARKQLTLQADALHLYTLGEGVISGSALINYQITGAPVSALTFEAPEAYSNLEFTGREVRNWQRTTNLYELSLHAPVSGTYSLLITYDLPMDSRGETISFEGIRPLNVQSEQGYVVLTSMGQFRLSEEEASPGLIALQPNEVPPEYRLLYDTPLLKGYQYLQRPFTLQINAASIPQGSVVNQVVDRALFETRISAEGATLTEARYFLKNKGLAHFRLSLPASLDLWSARVDDETVIPITDGGALLVPLPNNAPARDLFTVELELASRAGDPSNIAARLPQVDASILKAEWRMTPDPDHWLAFKRGSLTPEPADKDISGWAHLESLAQRSGVENPLLLLVLAFVCLLLGLACWRQIINNASNIGRARRVSSFLVGALMLLAGSAIWIQSARLMQDHTLARDPGLRFVFAPQQPNQTQEAILRSIPDAARFGAWLRAWPALIGIALGFWALLRLNLSSPMPALALIIASVFAGILRLPNTAGWIAALLFLVFLIAALLPALARIWNRRNALFQKGAAVPLGILAGFLLLQCSVADARAQSARKPRATVHSIQQEVEVKKDRARVDATIVFHASEGGALDFLHQPAVLTGWSDPSGDLRLARREREDGTATHRLLATRAGEFTVRFQYETPVQTENERKSALLPVPAGATHTVNLRLEEERVDVASPAVVSAEPVESAAEGSESASRFRLRMAPVDSPWIYWRPMQRDTQRERAVFYAEADHLFIPAAGALDAVHRFQVRPAQGEVRSLTFEIPSGNTIADVETGELESWQYDPLEGRLSVQLRNGAANPFVLIIQSQKTAGMLPYEQEQNIPRLLDAESQVGRVGIAADREIQLTSSQASLPRINLEDFPNDLLSLMQPRYRELALKQAFRYSGEVESFRVAAARVQPDIRAESRQTMSLGENRIVLQVDAQLQILRAGIFSMSFPLPAGLDVDSISGGNLSHWTELDREGTPTIILHFKEKTEGNPRFQITLSGAGIGEAGQWSAPRFTWNETNKETGILTLAPEQGLRLQAAELEHATPLDPANENMKRKSTLMYRLLLKDWRLQFDIEKVEPWIQATTLQMAMFEEGRASVTGVVNYRIQNAGVAALILELPPNARSVQFEGEALGDKQRVSEETDAQQRWELQLQRRQLGDYRLTVRYQIPVPLQTDGTVAIESLQPADADIHRIYLALQSKGRLTIQVQNIPASLQPIDWQTLPNELTSPFPEAMASQCFRAIESSFQLPVRVIRHESATLLPSRVLSAEFTSIFSESGTSVTRAVIEITPGDLSQFRFRLPGQAEFWQGSINRQSAWPWRDGEDRLLVVGPEHQTGEAIRVEFTYSAPGSGNRIESARLTLNGPEFDLPLKNIVWNLWVPRQWEIDDWESPLKRDRDDTEILVARMDIERYLNEEQSVVRDKTKLAESLFRQGNQLLQSGRPAGAQQAFLSAWNLAEQDEAFSEDARVQFRNVQMQKAIMGLNYRRSQMREEDGKAAPQAGSAGLPALDAEASFTQEQLNQAMSRNTSEENSALIELSQKLVRRQESLRSAPELIQASFPEHGKKFVFRKSIQGTPGEALAIRFHARAERPSAGLQRFGFFAILFVVVLGMLAMFRASRRPQ